MMCSPAGRDHYAEGNGQGASAHINVNKINGSRNPTRAPATNICLVFLFKKLGMHAKHLGDFP
jgi:hypothetical protein